MLWHKGLHVAHDKFFTPARKRSNTNLVYQQKGHTSSPARDQPWRPYWGREPCRVMQTHQPSCSHFHLMTLSTNQHQLDTTVVLMLNNRYIWNINYHIIGTDIYTVSAGHQANETLHWQSSKISTYTRLSLPINQYTISRFRKIWQNRKRGLTWPIYLHGK